MTYIVFVDTKGGEKRHSLWDNHGDCTHLVTILRESGYTAWWEFVPAKLHVPNGYYL